MRDKAKAPIDAPEPLGVDNFFLDHVKTLFFALAIAAAGKFIHDLPARSTKMTACRGLHR
jgi:hypothetical protein